MLKADRKYKRGQSVLLVACSSGKDEKGDGESFGQKLADELGASVYAPTEDVGISPSGETKVLDGGYCQHFKPR